MSAIAVEECPSQRRGRRTRGGSKTDERVSVMLPCRIRLADGRAYAGELPAVRHRRLHFGLLHSDTDGLVEVAVGFRRRDGTKVIARKKFSEFLPGGRAGEKNWLEGLLAAAERQVRRRGTQGVFLAPTVRAFAAGGKEAVRHTRVLWVDIDKPGQLDRLWALLAERPCHLLVESGGSGGVHAYFLLEEPLPATRVIEKTGELLEPIERAHLRIIHHLGVDDGGKPDVADLACKDRSRVMRLAGTVNGKAGKHARILEADFALPRYRIEDLVGDLPDPPGTRIRQGRKQRAGEDPDPYKRIPPSEYFEVLAGIVVPPSGRVRCPAIAHRDEHPSCDVGQDATQGWTCRACGAGGAIYDLASVLLGGPTGQQLRSEEFKRARAYVRDAFGELT